MKAGKNYMNDQLIFDIHCTAVRPDSGTKGRKTKELALREEGGGECIKTFS